METKRREQFLLAPRLNHVALGAHYKLVLVELNEL